jgi:hypothetical protein
MSRFTNVLIVSPLPDGKTWYLRRALSYDVGTEESGETINVPIGFLTDFASVPRPLWWFFPRWGRYGNAAVVHDFCYWDQSRNRAEVDRIFLEGMTVLGVRWFTRTVLYAGARLGVWGMWWKLGRRKAKGMSKIAIRQPQKYSETRSDLVRHRGDH